MNEDFDRLEERVERLEAVLFNKPTTLYDQEKDDIELAYKVMYGKGEQMDPNWENELDDDAFVEWMRNKGILRELYQQFLQDEAEFQADGNPNAL